MLAVDDGKSVCWLLLCVCVCACGLVCKCVHTFAWVCVCVSAVNKRDFFLLYLYKLQKGTKYPKCAGVNPIAVLTIHFQTIRIPEDRQVQDPGVRRRRNHRLGAPVLGQRGPGLPLFQPTLRHRAPRNWQ